MFFIMVFNFFIVNFKDMELSIVIEVMSLRKNIINVFIWMNKMKEKKHFFSKPFKLIF